jgi:glucan phosphoethanolaminetransferase (alkaline phosphatase superfamily)
MLARYLSIVFWLICIALLVIIFICRNKKELSKIKIVFLIFVILCSLSMFSPIDVEITMKDRDTDQNNVAIFPIVIFYHGSRQPIRDLESQGKIPYKDYVPYGISGTVLCYPRYVIVFFI